MNRFKIVWIDRGYEPKNPADPAYPHGIDLDLTKGAQPACKVRLDYPAKRCGIYSGICLICSFSFAVTTAGRTDDPKSVKVSCKLPK